MIASNRVLWLPNGEEDRAYNWDSEGGSMQRGNAAGIRIDSESALQCTVVLACARALAESLASLPLHIYENLPDGGKKISKAHPLYRRLHSFPNSWQTSFEWREQQVLWVCLWGNAYSLIVPGEAGFATELQPLHPSRMKVERIENGRLRYSYRDAAGKAEIFNQDQILHIRWLSDDGINGMVPVSLAKDAIGLARACEIHGAKFFANGARPGFVLSTDNDMKPEAASALRDNWEVMYRGAANANRTAVLFGGLKPIPLGSSSMVESQSMETRRFQIEEVCRLFRVPPHLVGDLTRSSFSNIEQQSIDFVQHTLLPWCRRFENAFARDLITEDEKYFAEFDTRGMLRGDAAGRASYFQAMWNLGVASINEIRGWENLNPIEGGDTRFVQLNMQTLAKAVTPEAQPEAPAEAAPAQAEQIAVQPEPVVDEQIADVSLNGAQINGIIAILDQVGLGALSIDGAASFISLSFPSIPAEKILSIVNGVIAKPPAPPPAARAFCKGEPGSGIDPTCGSGKGDAGGSVSVSDASADSVFEKEMHFKTEGGVIKVAKSKFSPADWSVIDTFVDEDKRGQGIASRLVEKVKQELTGSIAAQASSDKSVSLFWKHGFRTPDGGTIDDAKKSRKEDSSVLLIYDPLDSRAFCPGEPGSGIDPTCGSGKGDKGGGAFSSAPTASKGAAKWRKEAAKEYKSNPEFRAAADAAALYTQGEYENIRQVILQEKGLSSEKPKDDAGLPLSSMTNPMASYKNFIEGQDLATSDVPVREAAMALDKAVAEADPFPSPIFRGLVVPRSELGTNQKIGEWLSSVQPGDSFSMNAPTSFTASAQEADKFATGTSTGQGKNKEQGNGVILEVEAGSRALPVAALSPWKNQEELLSSGQFEIVSVEGDRPKSYKSSGYDYINQKPTSSTSWGWGGEGSDGVRMRIKIRQKK